MSERNVNFDNLPADQKDIDRYFRENFNTELAPEEEWRFINWLDTESERLDCCLKDDLDKYDFRGAFKSGDGLIGVWPEAYRKPSHPLFSTASIYHGAADQIHGGEYEGGKIGENSDGDMTFEPSQKMLETTHPKNWLIPAIRAINPEIITIIDGDASTYRAL